MMRRPQPTVPGDVGGCHEESPWGEDQQFPGNGTTRCTCDPLRGGRKSPGGVHEGWETLVLGRLPTGGPCLGVRQATPGFADVSLPMTGCGHTTHRPRLIPVPSQRDDVGGDVPEAFGCATPAGGTVVFAAGV
mmetsp:Transcript_24604/g.44622  ORF Transcript_24604/g.44622 Transcript_24604/m.44622 type:complete len:133 (-) Transcript_24604:2997-3395(-)